MSVPRDRSAIRVGLLVLSAIVALSLGIFLIGEKNNVFSRKNHYQTELSSASGLKPGNPVQLDGVDVGTVTKVVLPQDPNRKFIQVWIRVDNDYAERIRGPLDGSAAPNSSQARIKTLGLLGDKYIEISTGAASFPAIPDDGKIPSAQPTNVDALLASGEDVMGNVVEISASLSTILNRMEKGEGLLGELTTDSESGRRLKTSLIGMSESFQRIADKIDNGEGPLGRLLNDKAMADKLSGSLDRLDAVLASVQTGPGLAPALLNDPGMKTSVQDTLAQLNQVSKDLQRFTGSLETSEGLLPRMINDKAFADEVTGKLESIVGQLDEVSRKLSRGEGSAAKLLNDPQIYDAVNDVVLGVNESRLLRWLIRNRQKKGIEKRYEDTRKEMQEKGQTPPPLDSGPETKDAPKPPPAPAPALESTPPPEPAPDPTAEPTTVPPPASAPVPPAP